LEGKVKRSLEIIALMVLAVSGWLAAPASAQTAATTDAARSAPAYDASNEITLTGRVSNVLKQPASGMIAGGHLIVATAQGAVDAHVGGKALQGHYAIAVKAGDSVKLVGVMTTMNHSQVFLVRTVEDSGHTYTIRNKNGFLVTQMPEHGASTTPLKGSLR
jgi:hypothetical protein